MELESKIWNHTTYIQSKYAWIVWKNLFWKLYGKLYITTLMKITRHDYSSLPSELFFVL